MQDFMKAPKSSSPSPSPLRTVIIVQARMGSTRLPGKVLKTVLGKPLLAYQLERLAQAALVDEIVIATTSHERDLPIVDFCTRNHIAYFCGSEEDVLDRYAQAASLFKADVIVRVSSDCPLIDPQVVDECIKAYVSSYPAYDYVSNVLERTYPRGMDIEVFSFHALKKAHEKALLPEEREHVTPYIYRHPEQFSLFNVANKSDESRYRLTVDTQEDFDLIAKILEALYPKNPQFTMLDVLELLRQHPQWGMINAHVQQKPLSG